MLFQNRTKCYRNLFVGLQDFTYSPCLAYFDIQTKRFLNLEENNNFGLIRFADQTIYNDSKYGVVTVNAMAVEIFDSILSPEANCGNDTVFNDRQSGYDTVRLIYEFGCK